MPNLTGIAKVASGALQKAKPALQKFSKVAGAVSKVGSNKPRGKADRKKSPYTDND